MHCVLLWAWSSACRCPSQHYNPRDDYLKPFTLPSTHLPICTYPSPPTHIHQPLLPILQPKSPHHFPLHHCRPLQSSSSRGSRWKTSATRLWRSQTSGWLESGTAPPRWAPPAPTPGWLPKSSARLRSPRVATFGGGQGRGFMQQTNCTRLQKRSGNSARKRISLSSMHKKKFSSGSSCHSYKAQTGTLEREQNVVCQETGTNLDEAKEYI